MTDGDVLLAAVLRDPADDLPRLAYADWCEETGDLARAEFVRVQCELARLHTCRCAPSLSVYPDCPTCKLVRPLRRRAQGLMLKLTSEFRPPNLSYSWGVVVAGGMTDGPISMVSRGFVAKISLTLAQFTEHAAALFAAHPIERVTLADRTPTPDSTGRAFGWYKRHPRSKFSALEGELPEEIWDALPGGATREDGQVGAGLWRDYPSVGAADEALSFACVALGRRRAGPPALA